MLCYLTQGSGETSSQTRPLGREPDAVVAGLLQAGIPRGIKGITLCLRGSVSPLSVQKVRHDCGKLPLMLCARCPIHKVPGMEISMCLRGSVSPLSVQKVKHNCGKLLLMLCARCSLADTPNARLEDE